MSLQIVEDNFKGDTRKVLTKLAGKLDVRRMPGFYAIVDAVKHQMILEGERLAQVKERINTLRPIYNQFRDLVDEAETKRARMVTARAMLGNLATADEVARAFGDELPALGDPDDLRADLNLWEAIVEILRHVPQIQVKDICTFLDLLGIDVTRQAIDSAIETHKRLFRVKKRGREKFISLAG